MIQDLDETLKELLVKKVPLDLAAIDVQFDMPTKDWEGALSKPTINLFLYDVRENHELRSNERHWVRNGNTASEQLAPVRLDLTYLISAWATDVSDEHRLLGKLIATLLRYPRLPNDVLKGAMLAQPLPLVAWIAQPDRTPNAWDFWGSIDGRLKAGISYVVTAALEPFPPEEVEVVKTPVFDLHLGLTPRSPSG